LPVLSARARVTVASYFAWIGQIGMQLVLPAQTRRFWYGCELRPAGVGETKTGLSSDDGRLRPETPCDTA
jgi:hypothetical protein